MSLLAAVVAAFGPDVDIGPPNPNLTAMERKRQQSRSTEPISTAADWDADPIVAMLKEPCVYDAITSAKPATSTSSSGANGTPPPSDPAPILSSSDFLEEMTQPAPRAPRAGGFTLLCLTSAEMTACSLLFRELYLLRSILQRPPVAYQFIHSYDALMIRLAADHPHFVAQLLRGMTRTWAALVSDHVTGERGQLLLRLLCLHAEVLFHLTLHTQPMRVRQSAGRNSHCTRSGDEESHTSLDPVMFVEDDTLIVFDDAEGSARRGPGPVTRAFTTSPHLRRQLLELVTDLGGDVQSARAPRLPQPRRCAVLLTCVCLSAMAAFAPADFTDALDRIEGRCSLLDICLLGALPHRVSAAASDSNDSSHGSELDAFVALVISRMCHSTVYSLDLAPLFSEEGSAAALLLEPASAVVGATLRAALEGLSPALWRYFTKDALLSVARSLSMYSGSWPCTPACVKGLHEFAAQGFAAAVQSWAAARKARKAATAAAGRNSFMRLQETGHSSGQDNASVRRLLDGALGYGSGGAYDDTDERSADTDAAALTATNTTQLAVSARKKAREPLECPDTFDFATPSEQILYFLAIHAYTTAACSASWPTFCDGASNSVNWPLPRAVAVAKASANDEEAAAFSSNASVTGMSNDSPDSAGRDLNSDGEAESWALLFPTAVVLAPKGQQGFERGTHMVNLLNQIFSHLATLLHSSELPQMLATAPHSTATVFAQAAAAVAASAAAETVVTQTSNAPPFGNLLHTVFYDAAVTLLVRLLQRFPHELGSMSVVASSNVLQLFISLAQATLQGGAAAALSASARHIYDLLRRFRTALPNTAAASSLLLPPSLLLRIGAGGGGDGLAGGQPYAAAAAVDQLQLFVHLYQEDNAKTVLPSRLFLSIVHLEPGTVLGSDEALAYFAFYIQQVFRLLMADEPNVLSFSGVGADPDTMVNSTIDGRTRPDTLIITKAVGSVYTLLPVLSPDLTAALLSRISEGTLALVRACDRGTAVLAGAPSVRVLTMAAELLAEVTRLTGRRAMAGGLLLLPGVAGFNDGHSIPAAYALLAAIFQADGVPLSALVPLAQVLCAAASDNAEVGSGTRSIAPALRTHVSKPLRDALADSLHQRLRSSHGVPEARVVRLEVLRVLCVKDPLVAQQLVGPGSLPGNEEAREPADLIIAQVLTQIALSPTATGGGGSTSGVPRGHSHSSCTAPATYAEKAAALRCLTALGLTGVLPLQRVLTALSEATGSVVAAGGQDAPDGSAAAVATTAPFSALAFVAAASAFANAVLAAQAVARQEGWALGNSDPRRETPSQGSSPSRTGRGGVGPSATPLTLGAAGGGPTGNNAEAIDVVLRRGSECLLTAVSLYFRLSSGSHLFFPDTSVQLAHGVAGNAGADGTYAGNITVAGPSATANGGGAHSLSKAGVLLRVGDSTALAVKRAPITTAAAVTLQHSLLSRPAALRGEAALRSLVERNVMARSGVSVYHTEQLPDPIAEVSARQEYLFPLLLGPSFRYRPLMSSDADELVTAAYNMLASLITMMDDVAATTEAALWFSCRDGERSMLFVNRSAAVLDAALRYSLMGRPTAPALMPALWGSVQRGLSLAAAAAHAVRVASGAAMHTHEGAVTGGLGGGGAGTAGVGGPFVEFDIGVAARHSLRALVAFLVSSRNQLPLVNGCLAVFSSLGSATLELGAVEEVYHTVLSVILGMEGVPVDTETLANELQFMREVTLAVARLGIQGCPVKVVAGLLPALLRRATALAPGITPDKAEDTLTAYFCECLSVLRAVALRVPDAAAAATFLPVADVLRLAEALGHYASSSAHTGESTGRVQRRQNWHVCWCAVLDLITAVLVGGDGDGAAAQSARTAVWLPQTAAALRCLPRFLLALGGFTDIPEADRALYPWDVAEAAACTGLAAVMAAQGEPLSDLLRPVQRGFLSAHRFRILRQCVATSAAPETVASEARTVEATVPRMVCDQLSFLLSLPAHGVPLTRLTTSTADVAAVDTLPVVSVSTSNADDTLTFGALRRYVNQELYALRRASLEGASGRPSESISSTAPPTPSREPSVPPTPPGLRAVYASTATATEEDSVTLVEALCVNEAVKHRALHLNVAQLALCLFTAAAEEAARRHQTIGGRAPSRIALREVRVNCEKLLQVLDVVRRDIRKMGSPKTTALVIVMRNRLTAVVDTLKN